MAIGRVYTVDPGNQGVASAPGISIGTGGVQGTEWVLMYGGSAGEWNISALRVSLYSGASASYPSNGTITWRLRRGNGALSGIVIGTATASPIGQSTTAASTVWVYSTTNGSGTGTIATSGNILWSQTMPCTAGANWGEWFTPGFEINTGPGQASPGTILLTYEVGASGSPPSAVTCVPEIVFSE